MKRLFPVLLLAGAVVAVYLNSFKGVFQFDDYNVIVDHGGVHSWSAFLAGLPRGIRPLLKLTYTLNWTSGLGLFGFHLVNVGLHAANAVMLFRLASTIGGPSVSRFAALLPALLFAVHPVQTEAVTYISGRSVSLMAFFYLGSLLAYLRGRERGSRFLLYLASPILFLLAAASKEVAVTLPFALILCEAVRRERDGWKEALRAQAVHWALLLFLAVLFLSHTGYGRLLEACFDIRGAAANLFTQIHGVGYLLSRLVMPHALNIDPDLPVFSGGSPVLIPEALLLAALLAAGVLGLKKRSMAGFGILWFFLHLVPTNSFIPRLDVANERQLYLASWGLFLAVTDGGGSPAGEVGRAAGHGGRRRAGGRSRHAHRVPERGVPQRGRFVGGHGAEISMESEGMEQSRVRIPAGGPPPRCRGGVSGGAPHRSRVRARPGEPQGAEGEIGIRPLTKLSFGIARISQP